MKLTAKLITFLLFLNFFPLVFAFAYEAGKETLVLQEDGIEIIHKAGQDEWSSDNQLILNYNDKEKVLTGFAYLKYVDDQFLHLKDLNSVVYIKHIHESKDTLFVFNYITNQENEIDFIKSDFDLAENEEYTYSGLMMSPSENYFSVISDQSLVVGRVVIFDINEGENKGFDESYIIPELEKVDEAEWDSDDDIIIYNNTNDVFEFTPSTNELKKISLQPIFSDIPVNHPLYFLTKTAQNQGWISGYPDGTFKPEKSVNRAEFAKMLIMAFNKGDGNKGSLSKFPDVQSDQWYVPHLARAVELKIMQGYPDGTMKPGNTIIKAEALKMALEILNQNYPSLENEQWYEKYRRYAEENLNLDFISIEDMSKQMSRGECVELILEVLEQGS